MSNASQSLLQASQVIQQQVAALTQAATGSSGAAKRVLAVHARFLKGHALKMAQNARFLEKKAGAGGRHAGAGAGPGAGGGSQPAETAGGGLQVQWDQARTHSGFPPEARRWRKGEKGKWIYAAATVINKKWQNNRVIPFSYNGKPCVARQTWHSHQAATGRTGRFKATEVYPRK